MSASKAKRQPKAQAKRPSNTDSIRAMEFEVHAVLVKLFCANQVLDANKAVNADEEACRAQTLVGECVRDLERVLRYEVQS